MTGQFYCNRASQWAVAYLAALILALLTFWWVGFVGHNPLTVDATRIMTMTGAPTHDLRVGAVIGVHRNICSSERIGVRFFPSLRDASGKQFTLPPGVYEIPEGCADKAYGFVVPDIPPGDYTYICALQFQSSLVGRDDTVMAPPVNVRIVK